MNKKCICGNEMVAAEWKHQWVCHRCGRTEPLDECMTNEDYIHSLYGEELAEFLVRVTKCSACDMETCDFEYCVNLMSDWLEEIYVE